MEIEDQLKEIILDRYRSLLAFTSAIDIPYSTLDSALKRGGLRNVGVSKALKIFSALDLDIESIQTGSLKPLEATRSQKAPSMSEEAQKLAKDYDELDDHGKRVVRLVADEEKDRCKKEAKKATLMSMVGAQCDFEEEPDTPVSSVKESGAV